MARAVFYCVTWGVVLLCAGCLGDSSNELAIPKLDHKNSTTSQVSPQFAALGGVPAGVQAIFIGDVLILRGIHFRDDMKFFFGMNIPLARRPNSIFTTPRHLLPNTPFVFTDPLDGHQTILEVEAQVEFTHIQEIRVTVPPGVACHPAFLNPIVRMFGDAGSSNPITDVFQIVGPRCIALTPNMGVDVGGYAVTLHGDFLSRYTQIAFQYRDPATDELITIGDTPETDIEERFVDRHTLIVPKWPGVVPNSTLGLSEELEISLLLFENIDEINGSGALEPDLDSVPPCDALRPESPDAPLQTRGVRNFVKGSAFTFTPTGVTDSPSIAGITPEQGPEIGGNTVIVHGDQFDAFTADISDEDDPGIGIECPPGSGNFIAPLEVTLVDRQTLVLKMPPCSVEIPEQVDLCLKNKFSIDHADEIAGAGPDGDCVIFEDVYTFQPIPPIEPPVVISLFDENGGDGSVACLFDYGLERLLVVGDNFDQDTTLNGGFEFLLPDPDDPEGDPIVVQAVRTILHNRNLIEVYTPRLPAPFYPLTEDLTNVGVRVRNVVGAAQPDFLDVVTFKATQDAGETPELDSICPEVGPTAGGNDVLIVGDEFDTSTRVFFGAAEATEVQFVNPSLLIATAPSGAAGEVSVTVVDDGETTGGIDYTYSSEPGKACPVLGAFDPDNGTSMGGFSILAYGAAFTPTTRLEFEEGSGNFAESPPSVFYITDNLLRVTVPQAKPEQIGATVGVGASDPRGGCPGVLKTVDFTWNGLGTPEILFVDTTVEVPATATSLPALSVPGGDRMLVIGRNFDQMTTFDITKEGAGVSVPGVIVLTPNIAVMTSPAAPDNASGEAALQAHNTFGDSEDFAVEYTECPPPIILDVRNLDDGTQASPIDANDRILIFGDAFCAPVTVRLTGCDIDNQASTRTFTPDVTLVEDHLIGFNIPPNTFCEGPLTIEVITDFGTTAYETGEGVAIFQLVGPQPPMVDGVFESKFNSVGGEEAIFFGRFFTSTTQFSVRTTPMDDDVFVPVLDALVVSETVAIVRMPVLPGGVPPNGVPGRVKAEETDGVLRSKISGDPFTVSDELFVVCEGGSAVLLAVFPDHGFIDGCEQVLLLGDNFLTAKGLSNVSGVRFFDPALDDDVGDYVEATPGELPLNSLDAADKGKYVILNDHEILLITNPHGAIAPEDTVAAVDVIIESNGDKSMLAGGYTYQNTPAVLTPFLLGITPNETRLNGGTSHLISGGFLTEADRIVLTDPDTAATFTIPVDAGTFDLVNDQFLVFVMPDLSGTTFEPGDFLDVHTEKDVNGGPPLVSNKLLLALRVAFALPVGPEPELTPEVGSAFGGQIVEITGDFFSPTTKVLFGTIPAKHVVFVDEMNIIAIAPTLPLDVPDPGIDLLNIHLVDGTVDVAVFTPGGADVLKDAFTFEPTPPVVNECSEDEVAEGATVEIVVKGENFVPGTTVVTPALAGAVISDLEVKSFEKLRFQYTAPEFMGGTDPVAEMLTIETNHGTAAATCDLTVFLDPTLTDCTTDYAPNNHASPTSGVHMSDFVVGTATGTNFLAGGGMKIMLRTGFPVPLTEIGKMVAFSAQGQFRVKDATTIEFTPPNVFPEFAPNVIDGNPNVGPTTLIYTNPFGRTTELEDCLRYVPTFFNLGDRFSYTVPITLSEAAPDKLTTGDINADGVLDVASLSSEGGNSIDPEAFLYIADTFGPGVDVNGDDISPDFTGTFTRFVINNEDVRHKMSPFAPGAVVRLANLDDDDPLEIIIGVSKGSKDNRARVLIVDVNPDGTLGTEHLIAPCPQQESEAIQALAVGNFDSAHDGPDIALFLASNSESRRDIVILGSTATPFVFTDTKTDLDDPADRFEVGFVEAGDFDGDGDDDLIWGIKERLSGPKTNREDFPIFVGRVDAGSATVTDIDVLTNLTGGEVRDITTFDADGDGNDEAYVLVQDKADGALVAGGNPPVESGLAIVKDPFSLLADEYIVLGIPIACALDHGDFNADGENDLAIGGKFGEFVVYFGDGTGDMIDSTRSFTLAAGEEHTSVLHGLAVGDINHDGLAEVFTSDTGLRPHNIDLWLNTSR